MIFPQPLSRVAEHVSRHDFVLEALPPSGGLPLGNGDVSASLCGGQSFLALGVNKRDAHVGEIVLRIHLHKSKGAGPVTLRLYDATACVPFPDGVTVEAFVAATRSLIVLRVRSGAPARLPASLELCPESRVQSPESERLIQKSFDPGPATLDPRPVIQASHDGPFRHLIRQTPDGLTLAMCGFIYGARSHSTVREDAVVATFDLPPSGECLILVGIASSRDDPDPTRRARTEVERALPHGYLLLQREHAVSWERFWENAETEPPGALGKAFDCRERYALKSRRPHHDQTL